MRIPRPGASGGVPAIGSHQAAYATEAAVVVGGSEATSPAAFPPPRGIETVIAELARGLRSGELDTQAAIERLIDETIALQLGADDLERDRLALELKQMLKRCADTDPYLADKVKRLGKQP